MKNPWLLLATLLLPVFASAQNFSKPESVQYDTLNNRWLVGNVNSNSVQMYSPMSGTLTPFCSGMTSGPYGIEILGNVLYCCDGSRVRGYDLNNGNEVFNLNLNAQFLNGITNDGNGHLFVTDFSVKKIYRVNVITNEFNLMATTVKTPNGIYYDGGNNRLVFATWGGNAEVQALSLADSSVTTLIATTIGNIDGIIRDQQGNWYISSWSPQGLYRIAQDFSNPLDTLMTGFTQPADLGINEAGDSIGIPNSGFQNNVVFYAIPSGCDAPVVSISSTNPLCFQQPGSANAVVSGGTSPYSFMWSNGATTDSVFLLAGNYSVTVTDVIGCTAMESVTLVQPEQIAVISNSMEDTQGPPNCNGAIDLSLSGGTAPYAVTWSNGIVEPQNLCMGWYGFTVTDANGCDVIDSVYVDQILTDKSCCADAGVSIFPNPSNGLVVITLRDDLQNGMIDVMDNTGRHVMSGYFDGMRCIVQTSNLSAGVYNVVIRENGLVVSRHKLIVNR